MSISAADVKKLRDMTGAGMMDAKKALTESDGDFDSAVKYLREKGLADSKKRADKEANQDNDKFTRDCSEDVPALHRGP